MSLPSPPLYVMYRSTPFFEATLLPSLKLMNLPVILFCTFRMMKKSPGFRDSRSFVMMLSVPLIVALLLICMNGSCVVFSDMFSVLWLFIEKLLPTAMSALFSIVSEALPLMPTARFVLLFQIVSWPVTFTAVLEFGFDEI